MKRIFGIILCAVLTACGGAGAPDRPRGVAPANYEIGLDLSHHNGDIDWAKLDGEGISFLIFKATEGTDWKDSKFQENWLGATQRGYDVGAYHYYLMCKDGALQAQNFIQSVEVRAGMMAPVIDLEYHSNCPPDGEPEAFYAQLDIFIAVLEAEYGQTPMIYTTPKYYDDWLAGRYLDHPIWMRTLGEREPQLSDGRDWTIWQYSMTGRVNGIKGKVDLNRRRMADAPLSEE